MKTFFGITLGHTSNFIYFPLLLILIIILIYRFIKINKVVSSLVDKKYMKNFILNFSNTKNIIRLFLLVLGSIFLFFALLGPQWNKKEETGRYEGRDIFIALDISRSMLAKDLFSDQNKNNKISRLEFSKSKIKSLIKLLGTDRVGLILFSSSAFVQCPLTRDLSAFFMFLDQVDTQTVSSGSTAIDKAIKTALEKMSLNQATKNKILVIFTDGEDFSTDLIGVKKLAQAAGLNILSIGVGTPDGAPIPLFDESGNASGHQLDETGKPIISRMNAEVLRSLSLSCGGFYITGTDSNGDLKSVVERVNKFEKETFDEKKLSVLQEQYFYFIIISFLCFGLEWLL